MAIRSFMPFAYVAYLKGDKVQGGLSLQCLIESHSEIEDVRTLLKERYNLEFSEYGTSFLGTGYVEFSNITDDRDITLVIERVDILNVKSSDN